MFSHRITIPVIHLLWFRSTLATPIGKHFSQSLEWTVRSLIFVPALDQWNWLFQCHKVLLVLLTFVMLQRKTNCIGFNGNIHKLILLILVQVTA